MCAIEPANGSFVVAGIGDVSGVHVSQSAMVEVVFGAGLLGERSPSIRETEGRLGDRSLFVLFSDGVEPWLSGPVSGPHYFRSAEALASGIVDEYGRSDDDASCLIARYREELRAG